jgi:hypothetical protein
VRPHRRSIALLGLCLLGSVLGFVLLFGALDTNQPPPTGPSSLLGAPKGSVVHVQGLDGLVSDRGGHSAGKAGSEASIGGYGGATQALLTIYH